MVLYQEFLGDIFDAVALVQNTFNFVLLVSMSSTFRSELLSVLIRLPIFIRVLIPIALLLLIVVIILL